jgi:hypothetical protein
LRISEPATKITKVVSGVCKASRYQGIAALEANMSFDLPNADLGNWARQACNLAVNRAIPSGSSGLAHRNELIETPQMRLIPILFVASCSLCLAQQESDNERAGRMFFPPETKESTNLSKQASGPRRENSPSETIDMFFLGLKAGQIDAAYDGLVKGSVIADRREDVANLKDRTRHALDEFGPISGYELLEERTVGSTLLRRTCISFNSDLPLRWRFYFYKAEGTWKLVDLRIDDGLVELFEESIRPRK